METNTTFRRVPRLSTLERWAAAVPERFRFAVKAPREITHERRLQDVRAPLSRFVREVHALGPKLGPILIQLPPALGLDVTVAEAFFDLLRTLHEGGVVCEPRHPSWFEPAADRLLASARVARAATDPEPAPGGAVPGGWPGRVYYRLHGSPRRYYSAYAPTCLAALGPVLVQHAGAAEVWCIFDNTAAGAAIGDALALAELLEG